MEKYTKSKSGEHIGKSSHTTSTTALDAIADRVVNQSKLIKELNSEVDDRNTQIDNINRDITTKITDTNNLLKESDTALNKLTSSL